MRPWTLRRIATRTLGNPTRIPFGFVRRPARSTTAPVGPALGAAATRRAMNRRDADLGAGRDPSGAALPRGADDLPAMRMLAAGGGGRRPHGGGWTRCRGGLLHEALRRCLTQRGERQRRVHGVSHQGSEGALLRAAGCGQRGEHLFAKLEPRADGNRTLRAPESGPPAPFGSTPSVPRGVSASDLAVAQREPKVDQMSTLVRIFSSTASVNSVVPAWPPRSIVFTPPAVVSRTPSYTAREARSAPSWPLPPAYCSSAPQA